MNKYIEMRNQFLPEKLTAIFVFESPPSGGGYFYNQEGRPSETLFRSMMKLCGISAKTKKEGLTAFKNQGFLLVNPLYDPIDKIPDKKADMIILENYSNFISDLREIVKENTNIPLILVKSNICRLFDKKLTSDGFNVLNKGIMIPFPMHYHFNDFESKIRTIFLENDISNNCSNS